MSSHRVAIVTGASSGIGRALAERAVRAGWDVFAVGRRADRLHELAGLVAAASGSLTTLALDLREPGAAVRIVRETLAAYGRIDVLVNNAGGVAVGPISEQQDDALYEQFETHAIVPLALTREALPALRSSSGLVIFFGSGVARIPVGTLGAYPAAKSAVRSLARTARNELRPAGIAVTYVDPGAVATEFMTRAGFAGPPPSIAASPYDVARAVFAAFRTRQAVVNAVPWQTFFVALGEAFPKITDYLLSRAPSIVGGDPLPSFAPEKPVLAADRSVSSPQAVEEPHPSDDLDVIVPEHLPDVGEDEPTAEAMPEASAVAQATADDVETTVDVPQRSESEMVAAAVAAAVADAGSNDAIEGEPTTFAGALAPHQGRMKKLNLREGFVRGLLVPGTELELGYVAMRWAGMPNKNERGLTSEVLDSLERAGFLERVDAERFLVLREAEE